MEEPPHALYDLLGTTYGRYRLPDPRISAAIERALGDAKRLLNVGSGTGSYEPNGRYVTAVEPSMVMIRQRPSGSAPVIQAVAEHLPFGDRAFDAALALLTVHHWPDARRGLMELTRVASAQVILTWDPAVFEKFWLVNEYLPEIAHAERGLPTVATVVDTLDVKSVHAVPVPWDCTDGFCGAYWRRPGNYLEPAARAAISAFSKCDSSAVSRAMAKLEHDLNSGEWQRRHARLLSLEECDLGYRLVVAGN